MKLKELNETKLGLAAFECAEMSQDWRVYLGTRSVKPCHMDIIYTNSWHDPIVEAKLLRLLSMVQGYKPALGLPAPATTAAASSVFRVGYNADMIPAAPTASLISARSD